MQRIGVLGIIAVFSIFASISTGHQTAAAEAAACAHACGAGCAEQSLDPPPLPSLQLGQWQSERAVFPGALYVQDDRLAYLEKPIDLPGTKHILTFDYWRSTADTGQDVMDNALDRYADALSRCEFTSTRVQIPGAPYYVTAISADGPDSSVDGQLKIAQGKLRFITTTYELDAGDDDADSDSGAANPAPDKTHISGSIEIFVSDEISVQDLVARMRAMTAAGRGGK